MQDSGEAFIHDGDDVLIEINRVWAMPNKNTFDIPPISSFVKKYLYNSKISIDPFSRNKRWVTYTNDLDANTLAEYHLEARDFLKLLINRKIKADLIILDPPYSQIQVSRAYQNIGKEYKPFGDDNNATLYRETKKLLNQLLSLQGIALSFGWNSSGFGKQRGYEIFEILLVCHGAAHNDTICVAEKKIQGEMF